MRELTRKQELIEIHWEMYKSAHGVRPRWFDYDAYTEDELEKELDDLSVEIDHVVAEEKHREEQSLISFKKTIRRMMELGAETVHDAVRWILESEDLDSETPGYVCYSLGLDYRFEKFFFPYLIGWRYDSKSSMVG